MIISYLRILQIFIEFHKFSMYFMGFHGFQGSKVGGLLWQRCGNLWHGRHGPQRRNVAILEAYFILLRVVMFEAWMLEGLLLGLLSTPPIPFESGVDF